MKFVAVQCNAQIQKLLQQLSIKLARPGEWFQKVTCLVLKLLPQKLKGAMCDHLDSASWTTILSSSSVSFRNVNFNIPNQKYPLAKHLTKSTARPGLKSSNFWPSVLAFFPVNDKPLWYIDAKRNYVTIHAKLPPTNIEIKNNTLSNQNELPPTSHIFCRFLPF